MNIKRLAMILALGGLTACDYVGEADLRQEREDAEYRSAMDDYQAGRLHKAALALKKVCSANPANASARFQLACLLQDSEKDFPGAYCAFREYLSQRPESEKAKLAESRLDACERELAKVLAARFGLDGSNEVDEMRAKLSGELAAAKDELASVRKSLEKAMQKVAALESENGRLKDLMRSEGAEEEVESESPDSAIDEAKKLAAEAVEETTDEEDPLAEAKKAAEEEPESPAEPEQKPIADNKKIAAVGLDGQYKAKPKSGGTEHPDSYVVQEGDSLYKIARRFYGRSEAWKKIRDANKAVISADGRVKVGQRIVLPE